MASIKRLIFNMVTFIPGVLLIPTVKRHVAARSTGTGGTGSARYCYSVWLRHLVMAARNDLNTNPKAVAELGPGDSLGIGLAALLSGADQYYAFDLVEHTNLQRNLGVFDELVTLLSNRADIPADDEFPSVGPKLEKYDFPIYILSDERLAKSLAPARVSALREQLQNTSSVRSAIQYKAPWLETDSIQPGSVDMILSQAVLEHVDELQTAYRIMAQWLKPGAFISHAIDFKSHGWTDEWNGHWLCSDLMWRIVRGPDPWLINRQPYSVHRSLMAQSGFRVVCDIPVTRKSTISRQEVAKRFRWMSDDDLVTCEAFVQATLEPATVAIK
jgi:hypothetical protein